MTKQIVTLLERVLAAQEEQNEMTRETLQLLGEALSLLDRPAPQAANMPSEASTTATPKGKDPPRAHPDWLKLAFGKNAKAMPNEVFWPKSERKEAIGWVRVSIVHPAAESLMARVEEGCLCGNRIILKDHNGSSFYTCENAVKRCPHRPAAYFDRLTFVTSVPPE